MTEKAKQKNRGWVFKLALYTLLIGSLLLAIVAIRWQWFLQHPMHTPSVGLEYDIPAGIPVRAIAYDMEAKGLIRTPRFFILLARLQNKETRIKAGRYLIKPQTTPTEWLDQLVNGDVIQYAFRIQEGWTYKDLTQALAKEKHLIHTVDNMNMQQLLTALHITQYDHIEGLFFPDTYFYPARSKDTQILHRAREKMIMILDEEWQNRDANLPYQTPYEGLIMSSILEKETGVEYERAKIAGVLVRRLRRRMRLQVDPTVIYGLGDQFTGNLSKVDLQSNTPYNTYIHYGLPITPIALPSQASIHAAMHPQAGMSLYFVAKGDGSHVFSPTLAEHNKAVRTYILSKSKKKPLLTLHNDGNPS